MISRNLIFLPLLTEMLLTLYAFALLSVRKSRARKAGLVNLDRVSLHDDAWPEDVQKVSNNIRNQFQLPVLFGLLMFVFWAMQETSVFVQALAWTFVASRVLHFFVHTGSNYVPVRRRIFTFGFLIVLVLLGISFWTILRGPGSL